MNQNRSNTNQNQFRAQTTMEKEVQNSKFVGYSTEITLQSKLKGPLLHFYGDCTIASLTISDVHLVYCEVDMPIGTPSL